MRRARSKFKKIKCHGLSKCVNDFEEAIAEYIAIGGSQESDHSYDVFSDNISQPKHQIFKQL